jgi:hypothetical protein
MMAVLAEDDDFSVNDQSSASSVNSESTSQPSTFGTVMSLRLEAASEQNERRQSVRPGQTGQHISPPKSPGMRKNSSFHLPSTANTARGDGSIIGGGNSSVVELLDESVCKVMRLHVGPVNQVVISANGMWIFTAGADGSIFMLSTSKRAYEYTELPQSMDTIENKFMIIDKTKLQAIRKRLNEIEGQVDLIKKDNELAIAKIVDNKEKKEAELKLKMSTEIAKRDEAIILGRKEYLQLKNNMKSEIDAIHKSSQDTISDLELIYEKKLSQESLYLDKTKQAYDEYVVHNKMNLSELQRKAEVRIEQIETEKQLALKEAEKQKSTVLQYFDYVKIRNDEVMQSMEESQVEER